jgi:hypothetical protein
MATKRKKKKTKKNQVQVPFPVLLANVLVGVAVLGLSYMWLCLATVQKRLVNEQYRWSTLISPTNLKRAIRKHRLDMVMPREAQIVRGSYQCNTANASLVFNNK